MFVLHSMYLSDRDQEKTLLMLHEDQDQRCI